MKIVQTEVGSLLFERVTEILNREGLSPQERIPRYRTVLEELFKALTEDVPRHFSNLSARSAFVFDNSEVPKPVADAANQLRRFANRVVHEEQQEVSALDDARCLYQLCTNIHHFSRVDVPAFLHKSYAHYQPDQDAQRKSHRPPLPSYACKAVVKDIHVPPGEAADKFCILCCETDELGLINIKFWNNRKADGTGSDLTGIAELVRPYDTIYVTEVKPYPNQDGEYYATERSLVVLEPDFLVEAKELAQCQYHDRESSPLLYLLRRMVSGPIAIPMMKGNVVGHMLDEIATGTFDDHQASFTRILRDQSLAMLTLTSANGNYDNTQLRQIFESSRPHEPAIRRALETFAGRQLRIEPSFLSAKFGLQGRLDLLAIDAGQPDRMDILELKSGNPPVLPRNEGLHPADRAQTICYDLLLQSTYPSRIGNAFLLYSAAPPEQTPLRQVPGNGPLPQQELLMLRNRVVANELKIAAGDFSPIEALQAPPPPTMPTYHRDALGGLHQTLQGLPPLDRAYFLGFLRFIYGELLTAKIGNRRNLEARSGFAALWLASKAEKMENYDVLSHLEIADINDDFHISLRMEEELPAGNVSSLREGEMVLLYPTPQREGEEIRLNPLGSQVLKCNVLAVGPGSVTVSLVNKQVDKRYFEQHRLWAIEKDFRESQHRKMLQLNYQFATSGPYVREKLLGRQEPRFDPWPTHPLSGNLNEHQEQAVRGALAARDYFLIQGPPGTGKTSGVLCGLVRELDRLEENQLVMAFTNRAVDEICERLTEMGLSFIRLGRGDAPYYWSELSKAGHLQELHEKVARTRIFLSTQATLANSLDFLNIKKFRTLIVDEASQLSEPQLVGLLPNFERFVLIGDDNQLPPIVLQSEPETACQDPELRAIGLTNFRNPLFARLLDNAKRRGWDHCHVMLTLQYRMHADIARFSSTHFYDGRLLPGTAEQEQALPPDPQPETNPLRQALSKARITFLPSRRDPRNKVNDEEARLVADLVQLVAESYGPDFSADETIGVITPFRAQIANIRQHLPPHLRNITVDTVERFQGSERDIILISYALKSGVQLQQIQSVNDAGTDRKLNVALTRARKNLVILGHEPVLRSSPVFGRLLEYIESIGGYVGVGEGMGA